MRLFPGKTKQRKKERERAPTRAGACLAESRPNIFWGKVFRQVVFFDVVAGPNIILKASILLY